MENPLILVVDADPKNLQIMRDSLESSGFAVAVASDGMQAWEKVQVEQPDLILSEVNLAKLDGFQLLEKLKESPLTSAVPLMFLTSRREIQDRVRSLRGGVKDYLIKPVHVKEVIARIRMILRRMERIRTEESDNNKKLVGRLEEYSVVDLIENFGAERRTGILNVYNENNRNGEICFRNGAVVHASYNTLKAEKAVYQMLPWRSGHFVMTFKEISAPETISVSNIGLLLHGFKRMEQREQLFKELPSPETTFVPSETFSKIAAKKDLNAEATKFISLINGRRDIMQIIDESVYDDLQTLERLAKLYKQGLIRPGRATEALPHAINIDAPANTNHGSPPPESTLPSTPVAQGPEPRTPSIEITDDRQPRSNTASPRNLPPPDLDALDQLDEPAPSTPAFAANMPAPADDEKRDTPPEHQEKPPASAVADLSSYILPDEFDSSKFEQPAEAESAESAAPSSEAHTGDADAQEEEEFINGADLQFELEINEADSEKILFPGDRNGMEPNGTQPDVDIPDEQPDADIELNIPEPLSNAEMRPGLDLISPLLPDGADDFAAPQEIPENKSKQPAAAPEMPKDNSEPVFAAPAEDSGQTVPESPGTPPEEDIHQEETKERAKSVMYSFPLRSYGKPRIHEAKTGIHAADGGDSAAPLDTPPPRVKSPSPARLPQRPDPRVMAPPPQPPVDSPPPGSPDASKEQSTFADLDHLIPAEPTWTASGSPGAEPTPERLSADAEFGALLANLADRSKTAAPKFVIIGSEKLLVDRFATILLNGAALQESHSRFIDYFAAGSRKLPDGRDFSVLGLSIGKQFTRILDMVAGDLAGYILLIEASEQENLSYLSYLIATLKEKYDCPSGIAVFDVPDQRNFAVETIKDLIAASDGDYYIAKLPQNSSQSILAFLKGMASDALSGQGKQHGGEKS